NLCAKVLKTREMQKKSRLFISFPSANTFGEAKGRKKIERRTKRIHSFFMPRCSTFAALAAKVLKNERNAKEKRAF
ncbi:MAG: hypothetical protein II792_00185, partial [Prevotella sp.]|nr:hypothetical protein [Prevotella sp.]